MPREQKNKRLTVVLLLATVAATVAATVSEERMTPWSEWPPGHWFLRKNWLTVGLNDPLSNLFPPRYWQLSRLYSMKKETIGLQHTTRMARWRCMSPASLDRCHCQSVRCWCTSIDLLSRTTVSLSQSCQLYNREGVLTVVFFFFCHWQVW